MLFNFLIFLMIVLITGYLLTQGMLSAFLALVTSMFASILAMGLLEPLQDVTAKWRPESARGVTLLVVFLIVFAIGRIVADIVVPKNIKLPKTINRVAGGVLGFFTALVVMGTIVVGIEMLPFPRALMGFDRYPSETVMFDKETPGVPTKRSSGVWFGPDRFVEAVWNAASGRGLGGTYQWGMIHPDLAVENYGYRNVAAVGSNRMVPQGSFQVLEAWESKDPKEYGSLGIKTVDPERPVVMVRTQVRNGAGGGGGGRGGRGGGSGASGASGGGVGTADVPETGSETGGPFFRVTPTQVRLITDKGNQYYPIGYLEQGRSFVPLPLDTGRVVDDYVSGGAVEDWVFQIRPEEKAAYIEMKQLARITLGDFVKNKPTGALAVSQYPRKPYFKELSTLTVTVDTRGKKLKEGNAYLLLPLATRKDMDTESRNSLDHVNKVLDLIEQKSGGWTQFGTPGVRGRDFFSSAQSLARQNVTNQQDTDMIAWATVMPLLLAGQMQSEGEKNVDLYPMYFEETLEKLWREEAKGNALIQKMPLDETGKATLTKINPGKYEVFVTARTERGFFMWMNASDFQAATNPELKFSVQQADFALDLDAPAPGAGGSSRGTGRYIRSGDDACASMTVLCEHWAACTAGCEWEYCVWERRTD